MDIWNERLARAEQALPWITVDHQQIPDDYDTVVGNRFAGNEAPDLMQLAENWAEFESLGRLADLSSFLPDATERWSEAAVDSYSNENGFFAAPDRLGAMVVYYNKDLFDAAGLDYPASGWTWDDLRAAAIATTDKEGPMADWTWGYAAGDWWPWVFSWIHQGGGAIVDDDGNPVVNSPEAIRGLQFYNDLVFVDEVAPSPVQWEDLPVDGPDPLFNAGKLAMGATGFWQVGSLLGNSDLNWDVAPMPAGPGGAFTAPFGSGLAIASTSDKQEASAELIKFLTSAEGQEPIAIAGHDVPASRDALASDAFQNPSWNTADITLSVFEESAEILFRPPNGPYWGRIQDAFSNNLADVWLNQRSVEDGLNDVQAELERVLR